MGTALRVALGQNLLFTEHNKANPSIANKEDCLDNMAELQPPLGDSVSVGASVAGASVGASVGVSAGSVGISVGGSVSAGTPAFSVVET